MMNHISIPQYLLESSFCLAIFYLFYHLFLKRETYFQFNRAYLINTALFSLAIPIINIDFTKASHLSGAETMYPILSSVNNFQIGIHQTIAQESNILQISISDIITYVYMAGFFIMLLKLGSGLFKLFGIINRSPKMKDIDHTLLISNDVPAASFFSYIFWQDKHDKDDPIQKTIMDHEMVHVRQWHSLDVIVMELMVIIKWFNPLIYLFKNSLKQTHEFIADKYVTEKMGDKVTYASILLNNHSRADLPPMSNHFYGHIKERIKMLGKKQSNWMSQFKLLAAIPLTIILFSLFSFDLSDKLPQQLKTPFQAMENSMLATAETNIISLEMDEEIEKEKFYLTWGETMKLVLTQKYQTQELIFKYNKVDLNNLLHTKPSITQNGTTLHLQIDTLEVLKNNQKIAIDLKDLENETLRQKFIDSLGVHDQIMVELKTFSATDSLKLKLHIGLDANDIWINTTADISNTFRWGNQTFEFDKNNLWHRHGVRMNTGKITNPEDFQSLLDSKLEMKSEKGSYHPLADDLHISFEYQKVSNSKLASVDASEIQKHKAENGIDKNITYATSYYHGKKYQITENSFSMTIGEFYTQKEEFKQWLSDIQNGDRIAISITDPKNTNHLPSDLYNNRLNYRFDLLFKDTDGAISAPFPVQLPFNDTEQSNYQLVINNNKKSYIRTDVNDYNNRNIVNAYKNSSNYEIIHIPNFKTKKRVYETNLPAGKLTIADIMNPELRNLEILTLNDHYTEEDELVRIDWGRMVSMPGIGNYSLKEYKRSSKKELRLFTGRQHIQMDRLDVLIIPENGKIQRIRTDNVNTQMVRKILETVDTNTSIYIDNIIINIDGERKYYPYNFVFTVE